MSALLAWVTKKEIRHVDFVRNITYVRRLSTKFHQNSYVLTSRKWPRIKTRGRYIVILTSTFLKLFTTWETLLEPKNRKWILLVVKWMKVGERETPGRPGMRNVQKWETHVGSNLLAFSLTQSKQDETIRLFCCHGGCLFLCREYEW